MAIKTNYNFKGIKVPEVTIRVIRIFGSSKEGFNSLIGVYTTTKETIPAVEEATDELIEEFNFQVPFNKDERGYETIYKALTAKYGGEKV